MQRKRIDDEEKKKRERESSRGKMDQNIKGVGRIAERRSRRRVWQEKGQQKTEETEDIDTKEDAAYKLEATQRR